MFKHHLDSRVVVIRPVSSLRRGPGPCGNPHPKAALRGDARAGSRRYALAPAAHCLTLNQA